MVLTVNPSTSISTDQSDPEFLSIPNNQTISPDDAIKLVWIVNPALKANYSILIEQINYVKVSLVNGSVENGIIELQLCNLPITKVKIILEVDTLDNKITSVVEIIVFDAQNNTFKDLFTYFSRTPIVIISLLAIFVKFKFMNNTRK